MRVPEACEGQCLERGLVLAAMRSGCSASGTSVEECEAYQQRFVACKGCACREGSVVSGFGLLSML